MEWIVMEQFGALRHVLAVGVWRVMLWFGPAVKAGSGKGGLVLSGEDWLLRWGEVG